jgi:hypothetical protein
MGQSCTYAGLLSRNRDPTPCIVIVERTKKLCDSGATLKLESAV